MYRPPPPAKPAVGISNTRLTSGTAITTRGWPECSSSLATALVLTVYFREGRNVGFGHRLLMAGLRLGVLVLLLLVLLPQLRVWYERQGWPDVVDHFGRFGEHEYVGPLSRSQGAGRCGRPRPTGRRVRAGSPAPRADLDDAIRSRLAASCNATQSPAARLSLFDPAAPLGGCAKPEDLAAAVDAIHNLQADARNDSTQLGAAVRQVLGEYNASSLAAVVILTDGVTTEGETLEQAAGYAKDQGVPLFFVGVGDANDVPTLRLHDLQAVDSVFVNDRIFFELTLTGKGYAGLKTTVTVKEKGKDGVLATKNIVLKTDGEDVKVQLEVKPTERAKTYIIETPLQPDEADKEDNRIERKVLVREAKLIKVLYVEGYRRYEYHYLKTLLERESDRAKGNKSIDLKVVLMNADPDFAAEDRTALAEIPTKEELKAYDVVILGDVDPTPKDNNRMTEHLKDIAEWVTDHGGGLLMIAGERYAPFYYKDSPLRDVLPIDVVADRPPDDANIERAEGYKPVLTPEGLRHPIFRFKRQGGRGQGNLKRLRDMYWWSDVVVPRARPRCWRFTPGRRRRWIKINRPATNHPNGRRWWFSSS